MNKFILSLGLIAALAAPAMAQSSYDDSASNVAAGGNSGVATPGGPNDFTKNAVDPSMAGVGVDTTTTNAINDGTVIRNDPVNHPMPQRGDQGQYFGANGH